MFVEVSVVLAGVESSVFLFNEEEGGGLRGVGGTDFSGRKVLVKESFGGKALFRRERVEFPDFGSERVGEVDFMIVGSRWGNMVCSFLSEN